jgi:DNA invertase Pin-like site-specific DNA recombinase
MSSSKPRKVALYLRVSTKDQTTENQRRELLEVAERAGWNVVATYSDEGISGAKGRANRPGLDALLKAVARREVTMVAAWSVDRLGRSLTDLMDTLGALQGAGADLYLHKQALDTGTPSGRALFGMLGVFAEFEREVIAERVRAGMATAKAKGKTIGRPKASPEKLARIRELRAQGMGVLKVAREVGCGVSLIQRLEAQEAA